MPMTSPRRYYEHYWTELEDVTQHDPTTARRRALLLETLERYLRPGEPVLDLGCGTGMFASSIQEKGFDAIGADLSEAALAIAQERAPRCTFVAIGPDGSIPLPENHFAAVWCSEVIEHVLDVVGFLREAHRVLREDGLLILTTPHHGLVKNAALAVLAFDRHFDPLGAHVRFFSKASLTRCLAKAGFESLRWTGIGRIPPVYRTMFVVSRKKV